MHKCKIGEYGGFNFRLNGAGDGYILTDAKAAGDMQIPSHFNGLPVIEIGRNVFMDCAQMQSVTIPETVTSIGFAAFSGCGALKSVKLPDGLTRLSDWAFGGCRKLTCIKIPEGIASIGDYCFYGCIRLESIVIPKTVTRIGVSAFSLCEKLKSVYYSGTDEEWAKIDSSNNANLSKAERLFCTQDMPEADFLRFGADGGQV